MSVITRMYFLIASLLASIVPISSQAVTANVNELNIVAIGDSYTAGNAAGEYYGPQGCYRSKRNYSEVYADFIRTSGWIANYTNLACSSARSSDIATQITEDPSAVSNADIVFLSIGGNDGDFEAIVRACIVAPSGFGDTCVDMIEQKWLEVDTVVQEVESGINSLLQQVGEHTEVVLVGYPQLLGDCDYTVNFTHRVTGEVAVYYLSDELRNLQRSFDVKTKEMIDSLASAGSSVRFVSLHQLYEGHEYCGSADDWLAGLVYTGVNESFHPNSGGHYATGEYLYSLGIHSDWLNNQRPGEVSPQRPDEPLQQAPAGSYANLPFGCGVIVPYASTYDIFHGITHGHALDFPMPTGTALTAVTDGRVYVHNDPNGYGIFVDLVSGDTVWRYAHLSEASLPHDTRVRRGDLIGRVGSTGFSTGPHLHFEQIIDGAQVPINLGGPALNWGGSKDSSGFRTTTHDLVSGNCQGTASVEGPIAFVNDAYADLVVFEHGDFRYAVSDGYDQRAWTRAHSNMTRPHSYDVCDFDGDGQDEYLSYERDTSKTISKVIMLDVGVGNSFSWSSIANVPTRTDKIVCGDWNRDGLDDLIYHTNKGEVVFAASLGDRASGNRSFITKSGMHKPSFWDVCDINGDGLDEIVLYEAHSDKLRVGVRKYTSGDMRGEWKTLLTGIYDVQGMTCNNFMNYSGDELVVWQPEQQGRFMLGVFNLHFQRIHWDPLSPTGFTKPYRGELVSGDIDGDGYAEFVSNELRASGNHSVMVGDFTSTRGRQFTWYPFIEGIAARNVAVGQFLR